MLKIASTSQESKMLSRQFNEHKLRKIYRGIYTDDLESDLEDIVLKHWMQIITCVAPKAILSFRTAVELKPQKLAGKPIVFVISSYVKTINLPGLTIKVYKGNSDKFTEQVLPGLARSNTPRYLLENLTTVRGAAYIGIKTIGIEGVEKQLIKELRFRGENSLKKLRDEAKIIAKELKLNAEFKKLNNIVSTLLSSHPDESLLSSPYAKALVQKAPYDEHRCELFDKLALYLKNCNFINREYQYNSLSFKNLSFFESYFSNFIEGTEFLIDEAEDIIFQGIEINNRHADSHDILANFLLTSDHTEMSIIPKTPDELIEILQRRHAILMKERPEKRPGEFKIKPNKVGNTFFVLPEETLGTLYQGFERYNLLNPGLEKALFMQFLISEVHPFDDGNGRLSRIMMNAELASNFNFKIIVPSVSRDNYLNGLRLASRDQYFRTYVKVMDQAQAYTALINWQDYDEARTKLENDSANLNSDEGIPIFNRVLRLLELSDIPS